MQARQTAIPCTLAELKDGKWVQQAELPSGVQTPRGLLARVNVYGVIIEHQEHGITLDDGTARMHVRSFDPQPRPFPPVGTLVLVIGKPREYNQERYLAMEICKPLKRKEWVEYRKRELQSHVPRQAPVEVMPVPETISVYTEAKNPFETIVERIRQLDDGKGADVQELLDGIAHPDKETLLKSLLEEGEIFEIKPGRVKVLE